ncbi:MAG: TadE/TadG family type IV pilus assembly protein [Candidatus Acidiferrales bacterium]
MRIAREETASELVEAAIVLNLLLALLIGIIWIARAYNVYETLTFAAREGARVATSPTCSACGGGNTPPSNSTITKTIDNALKGSGIDPSKLNPGINIQNGVVLNPGDPSAAQVTGVVISFGYPFKFTVPFTSLNAKTITISTKVEMRQEF